MSKRTLVRYVAFQSMGWLAALVISLALWSYWGVPAWIGVVLTLAWIAKDFALYPFMRGAYESAPPDAASAFLVGARGVVTQDLDPEGWIRVQGALWQARASGEAERFERGRKVRVESVEGLRLLVRAEDDQVP